MNKGERYRRIEPQETIEILTDPAPLTFLTPEGEDATILVDDSEVDFVRTMTLSGMNEGYERTLAVHYIERNFEKVA